MSFNYENENKKPGGLKASPPGHHWSHPGVGGALGSHLLLFAVTTWCFLAVESRDFVTWASRPDFKTFVFFCLRGLGRQLWKTSLLSLDLDPLYRWSLIRVGICLGTLDLHSSSALKLVSSPSSLVCPYPCTLASGETHHWALSCRGNKCKRAAGPQHICCPCCGVQGE